MSRKCVFENTGIGFSIVEILQEPECREDQLEQWGLKNLETSSRLI